MGLLYAWRKAGGRTRVPRKWDLLPRLQLPAALSLWAALPELPVHVCELPRYHSTSNIDSPNLLTTELFTASSSKVFAIVSFLSKAGRALHCRGT